MKTLKDKITSKEEMPLVFLSKQFRDHENQVVEPPWWLKREFARIESNIYPPPTEVIEQFNKVIPQFALHIAEEEPTMIAYTPDQAYGMADRQVRTSLARFVVKYYSHLSDDKIRDLQSEHLAELDTNFEQLTGQALIDVYKSGAVAACMSKADREYSGRQNPTEAYDAPNISMAVLRDKSGAVTARCMLYCPTPTDKRYIRGYGDGKLISKLKRCGYKPGTWHGAVFKTILSTREENVYLMPYLDGNGSLGSMDSSCVALIDGKIRSITREVYSKLLAINNYCVSYCTSTSGVIRLENISSEQFTAKCALTNRDLNLLTETVHKFWVDGEIKKICHEALDILTMKKCYVTWGGTEAYVMGAVGTFSYRSSLYLDLPEIREHFGWTRLSPKYYPTEQDWILPGRLNEALFRKVSDGSWIKEADAVYVAVAGSVPGDDSIDWVNHHESEIGKGYTKLHSMQRGRLYYAAPGVTVVKTVAGRKVVKGLYSVHTCLDGTVDFERNLSGTHILGERIWWAKGEIRPDLSPGSEVYKSTLRKRLEVDEEWDMNAYRLVYEYLSRYIEIDGRYLYKHEETVPWTKLWDNVEVQSSDLGKAINKIMQERTSCVAA